LAKNGSFGFAKGRLVCRAKPNVPFLRLAENFKIFCAVGKKLKHRRVGKECRLTRCPNVLSFLCRWSPVKMVYFFLVFSCLFVVARSSFTLAGNVLGLCEGGEIEVQMFNLAPKFIRIPMLKLSTNAPLLQNPCYLLAFCLSLICFNSWSCVITISVC